MSKHVFIITEHWCQSFWQLVKLFRFEAKKIEERGSVRPSPRPLESSWVKGIMTGTNVALMFVLVPTSV